jgi:hypothetical protein
MYFASGVALAVIACVGLRQLTIAKENAKMSAKRESYKLAADQCAVYFAHIIPLLNELNDAVNERKIEFFKKARVEISDGKIKVSFGGNKKLPDELLAITPEATKALNSLESFSIFFMSGVAAEDVAFKSVGYTFCNSVEDLLPLIIPLGTDKYFQNIVQLFLLWHARIESRALQLDKAKLEARLKDVDNKFIKPIGT